MRTTAAILFIVVCLALVAGIVLQRANNGAGGVG